MTCDVTALGVVVPVDSQPTLIHDGSVQTLPTPRTRRRLIGRTEDNFSGFITFVGTEGIGDTLTGEFLGQHSEKYAGMEIEEYLHLLADDLTAAWKTHDLRTGLYIHAAGAIGGEPAFLIVNNIGAMEGTRYLDIRQNFTATNHLERDIIPAWRGPGETKMDVLARAIGYLRNGSLDGVLEPFDDFNGLMSKLYDGRYAGFKRFESVTAYSALVRMRCEFIARLYVENKALYAGETPILKPITVVAADLEGKRWRIPVKDLDRPKPFP